jgi:hypothetical protein
MAQSAARPLGLVALCKGKIDEGRRGGGLGGRGQGHLQEKEWGVVLDLENVHHRPLFSCIGIDLSQQG